MVAGMGELGYMLAGAGHTRNIEPPPPTASI